MTTQVGPGKAELDQLLRLGLTQAQIVEEWERRTGVRISRSTVSMAVHRYGLKSPRTRDRYMDLLPWNVAQEHQMDVDARMLRLEARRRRGKPLSPDDMRRLELWREDLDDNEAVIYYDRDHGFLWIPRTEEHDDIIDRSNVESGAA